MVTTHNHISDADARAKNADDALSAAISVGSIARIGPLPTESLGGNEVVTNGFENSPNQWQPLAGHREARLDWSTLAGLVPVAELRLWVINSYDQPSDNQFAFVRIQNVTDNVVVATSERIEPIVRRDAAGQLDPVQRSLTLPRDSGTKHYRVEVQGTSEIVINGFGEIEGELILVEN